MQRYLTGLALLGVLVFLGGLTLACAQDAQTIMKQLQGAIKGTAVNFQPALCTLKNIAIPDGVSLQGAGYDNMIIAPRE